jgi:DNA-3-methyladenine glycosylase II
MWFENPPTVSTWDQAVSHLVAADPILAKAIGRVGPCTLAPRRDYFTSLCRAIFAQQLSTAVANVLFGRFTKLFGRGKPTPKKVLALSDEQLISTGLSRQKRSFIRDLALKFADGEVPVKKFPDMSDEEIVQALLPVKGIGRWTVEMFLIFVMNRPDVWPIDDLGVRKVVMQLYGLRKLPEGPKLIKLAEPWRPWRTVATWYLWRFGGLEEDRKRLERRTT